jgi:hypothetical protein
MYLPAAGCASAVLPDLIREVIVGFMVILRAARNVGVPKPVVMRKDFYEEMRKKLVLGCVRSAREALNHIVLGNDMKIACFIF